MCFNPLAPFLPTPSTPVIPKLPEVPTPDMDAVRQRELREAELLSARGGTAATVKTDLAPAAIAAEQAGKRVKLGV